MVETISLSLLALLGLGALRWADRAAATRAGGRRASPRRGGRLRQPAGAAGLAGSLAGCRRSSCSSPHAVLVSFVPRGHLDDRALPAGATPSRNYMALLHEPEQRPPAGELTLARDRGDRSRRRPGARSPRASLCRPAAGCGGGLRGAARHPVGGARDRLRHRHSPPRSAPTSPGWAASSWSGTPWILPLAYLVRNLPLTGRALLAGLRQLDPALEEAAASLGADRWRRLGRVVAPPAPPRLAAGAGLAFITALGDFVISVVLYTYRYAPDLDRDLLAPAADDFGLAAAYGVLLMVASAAAFALGGRARRAEHESPCSQARSSSSAVLMATVTSWT